MFCAVKLFTCEIETGHSEDGWPITTSWGFGATLLLLDEGA